MTSRILLAAGNDFHAMITLAILIISGIGWVLSKLGVRSPSQTVKRPTATPVQDQIEEFLRRAAARREDAAPSAKPVASAAEPVQAQVVDDDEVDGSRVTRQVRKYMDTSDFSRRSEQMGEEVVQADQQFTSHVKQAFTDDVGTLGRQASETAAPPQAQPVVMETDEDTSSAGEPETTAFTGLLDLFGSPNNIVQAIVMSEIIRRPGDTSAIDRPTFDAW